VLVFSFHSPILLGGFNTEFFVDNAMRSIKIMKQELCSIVSFYVFGSYVKLVLDQGYEVLNISRNFNFGFE